VREARRLAPYVQPSLPESRLGRQWSVVAAASDRSPPPRKLLYTCIGALALVPVLVIASRVLRAPASSHASVEIAAIEGGAVTLRDGSRIAVETGGRVRVLSGSGRDVELVLESGTVDLDVPHTNRRMTVHVGRYDVVDLGTHFRVALAADGQVAVHVAEGTVEVRPHGGAEPLRALSAGDVWSNGPAEPPHVDAPRESSPVATPSVAFPAATTANAPEAGAPTASARTEPASSAKDLLELAERQRLAGNPRAAAAAFDMLRRRHRGDPRAPLAAFELGRLRLDAWGDAHGAVEALTDSLALSPNEPLREDAEALRVEALNLDHSSECVAARTAFLARYPHSVHRAVAAACNGP